jgi:POT family proton-dependent oligopeptide transporter
VFAKTDSTLENTVYKKIKEEGIITLKPEFDTMVLDTENDRILQRQGLVLDSLRAHKDEIRGKQLFYLAKVGLADIDEEKARANSLDFPAIYAVKDSILPAEKLHLLADKQIVKVEYPTFVGRTIHNLFEFFMVFVVLCGLAAVVLFSLTPLLKKMMHGVR